MILLLLKVPEFEGVGIIPAQLIVLVDKYGSRFFSMMDKSSLK